MENKLPYTVELCRVCSAENTLYLMDLARCFSCKKCQRLHLRNTAGEWKEQKPGHSIGKKSFFIPLHSKATIDGDEYTIVARLNGKDNEGYSWKEYWAYNALKGFIYFSEYNGHWVKATETKEEFQDAFKSMDFFSGVYLYRKYSSFGFNYQAVEGELPFEPVTKGFHLRCEEFISPPYFISREKDEDEITYYRGEHISVSEIETLFGKGEIERPYKKGVGMVEPYAGRMSLPDTMALTVAAGIILIVISAIYFSLAPEKIVYEKYINEPDTTKTFVSPAITLEGGTQNLQFDIDAGIDNNWAGASIDVVNIVTGEMISLYDEVEYYEGYEGGEHWSEGSRSTVSMLSSVPDGTYQFEISPVNGGSGYGYIHVTVTRGTIILRNLFYTILALAIFPLLMLLLSRRFEISRWSNSNYSIYDNE